jgi:hypothetical protein
MIFLLLFNFEANQFSYSVLKSECGYKFLKVDYKLSIFSYSYVVLALWVRAELMCSDNATIIISNIDCAHVNSINYNLAGLSICEALHIQQPVSMMFNSISKCYIQYNWYSFDAVSADSCIGLYSIFHKLGWHI